MESKALITESWEYKVILKIQLMERGTRKWEWEWDSFSNAVAVGNA